MGRIAEFFKREKKDEGIKTNPATKEQLQKEEAYAVAYTNRQAWSDFSVFQSLTPEKLAGILRDVRSGECPADYLELSQDMEIKDLHYRSVLSTRKDAVCGLAVKVIPASKEKRAIEIAEAVRQDIVDNTAAGITRLIRDMLDALAKGFSVNEIIWDCSGSRWKPLRYLYRDPRWFQYDKETGQSLMLRDPLGSALTTLAPYKYIIHEPHLISGTQIVSGLALPALFYFMLKSYDVTSWAAFIDRYGYPIRLGKYGRKASDDDIKTLKRAVAAIGSDFGAVIPESAQLEIIETKNTGDTSEAYQKMAVWVDKQISKLVLGQTLTVDEGASRAQSQVHEEVRQDIATSDVVQLVSTLHTSLTVPYVRLNFGDNACAPLITLYKPDEKNIEQVISAVEKLGPQGFTVKADEIRELLGLSKPEKTDEVIGGVLSTADDSQMNYSRTRLDLNSRGASDPVEETLAELEAEAEAGYVRISDDIVSVLEEAANDSTDFDSFRARLEKLATDWPVDKLAELMAVTFFTSRSRGDCSIRDDE